VYISVRLIQGSPSVFDRDGFAGRIWLAGSSLVTPGLIRQFAQFVTSFYHLKAFCSANTSFAVWLLMSKQLVRVGIQQIKDLYLRILHLAICLSNLYTRWEARPDSQLRERAKSLQFVKDLNGVW